MTISLKTDIASGNNLQILLIENRDTITRLNESGVRSKDSNKSIRHHDKISDTYWTEAFNFLKKSSPTNISKDNDLYRVLKKQPIIREAIFAKSFPHVHLPSPESQKELTVPSTIIIKDIIKVESQDNTSFQEVHLVNPKFQSEIKGSGVTDTLLSPIHEDFDAIDGNDPMMIKDNKERNTIIANTLNYNPIDDQMDIMNRRRKNMNVKVIDERINDNDQSHQNEDNTTA